MTVQAGQVARESLASTGKIMAGRVARETVYTGGRTMVGLVIRETVRSSTFITPTCADLLAATSSGVVVESAVASDTWIDDFQNGAQTSAP